jgi:hypothetical protein
MASLLMTTIDGLIVDDHIFYDPHCEPFQLVIWFILTGRKIGMTVFEQYKKIIE